MEEKLLLVSTNLIPSVKKNIWFQCIACLLKTLAAITQEFPFFC